MGHLDDIGKENYFEKHGYEWVPRFEAYINREQWKVFTRDYINDHSFDTLLVNLEEAPVSGQWTIYTNTESEDDIHNLHRHYGTTP